MRRRLDFEIVRRGLASGRAEAAELIADHRVTVGGVLVTKPSRLVAPGEPVEVSGPPRKYVGRGGFKLETALESFSVDVVGRNVLDAGSSTGGFTDCLLQRGAARVAGFDVGRGQMHERLLGDVRVVQRDRFNIRDLRPEDLPFPCSMFVADLSFISLTLVLGTLIRCIGPEIGHPTPEAVVLVKPQFEAGRDQVSRGGGVVTDPAVHAESCTRVAEQFEQNGWSVRGTIESPIRGAEGNTEFLMWATAAPPGRSVGQTSSVCREGRPG